MTRKVYYIENSALLDAALKTLKLIIPCAIHREYIEMDYSEVKIYVKAEDICVVEKILAPLV